MFYGAICVYFDGGPLKDVSYSVKQNGLMVNLDYTEPINDDDIIGWKSDEMGIPYLARLRAPKVKAPKKISLVKSEK